MNKHSGNELRIGWASADLTPDQPVLIAGQFHARVSEGIMDPVTATVLALESCADDQPAGQVIMVSCDFALIPDSLRDAVRVQLKNNLPELDPMCVFLNATHTHAAPEIRTYSNKALTFFGLSTQELGVMEPDDYVAFAVQRIVGAIKQAWQTRAPGGIGFGLGQAMVGRNRRICYYNGEARMYGNTNDPDFSHVEGAEDHSVNLLCTWNNDRKLTGMVINVACPSQVSEQSYLISADYWHDTRVELRRRLGAELFVLPQCSAAGDQSPHILVAKAAEQRMWRLMGRTQRQDIAARITSTIVDILPFVEKEIDWHPRCAHRTETLAITRCKLTEADVREAQVQAEKLRSTFEELRCEFDAHPEKKAEPHWYINITSAYRRMLWFKGVEDRFKLEQQQPRLPIELHVLRLGDVALASNPFEYYLDFGMQIKARSPAVQTFVVQLAGSGTSGSITYVPTARAVSGKSYGAVPASTPVGPEGGRELVQKTVEIINSLWACSCSSE